MKRLIFMATLGAAVCTLNSSAFAQKKAKKDQENKPKSDLPILKSNMDTVSYLIGNDIAHNFKSNGIDLNFELMYRGILDAQKGADTVISKEKTQAVLMAFQQQMSNKRKAQESVASAGNKAIGAAFLDANKTKEGVVTLPSGLQYKVIKEGAGESPKETDMVRVEYSGTLIDGTVFDATASRGKPAEFAVNGVIPGWTEGLMLMKPGAKYMFYIPAELAYGDQKTGPIAPGSSLIFEVELIAVNPK